MVHPQLKHRLSSMDSLFLYFERKEAPMNIGSAIIMDGVISFTEFKEMIAAKLPLLPRYRQKLVPSPFNSGHPTWELDPNFDISRHILDINLDAPGTMEELRLLAGKIHSTMLDRSKPLWEIYVVNGLEGERSALITKVHHAMADGVSGVDLMEIVLDSSPSPTPVPIPEDTPPAPAKSPTFAEGLIGNWLDSTEEALKNWSMFQRSLLDLAQNLIKEPDRIFRPLAFNLLPTLTTPAPTLAFNRANTGQLELSWTEFPFADFHAIRAALGGTINDVGLTVLGSAVAKYLKTRHDSLAGRSLRLMVPVNMRPPDQTGALGNMISMLPVEIPLDLEDPLKLYAFVTNETGKLKDGHIAEELSLLVNLWGILPSSTQAMIGSIANTPLPLVNMVCTNVPGPKIPLYVLGKRVTHCYPYVPTAYLTSLSCAIFSYDKKLFFGLTADAQAVPDLNQHFKPLLEQAFKELRKAAGVSKSKVSLAG